VGEGGVGEKRKILFQRGGAKNSLEKSLILSEEKEPLGKKRFAGKKSSPKGKSSTRHKKGFVQEKVVRTEKGRKRRKAKWDGGEGKKDHLLSCLRSATESGPQTSSSSESKRLWLTKKKGGDPLVLPRIQKLSLGKKEGQLEKKSPDLREERKGG